MEELIMKIAMTIKTLEEQGVLNEITKKLSSMNLNIVYTHLYLEKNNFGSINLELENVEDVEYVVKTLKHLKFIKSIEVHSSLIDIYGKRIIIIGGGVQVSQVATGAITEADRHNLRGERISVDTIPLVGEKEISDAINAITRLPRVRALVLAGSIMGGEISNAVKKIKEEQSINVISLNMVGSAKNEADIIVTDPTQAGVMAVMSIADTAELDINKIKNIRF
jgi:energy-converting hydrogenase B subunit Q